MYDPRKNSLTEIFAVSAVLGAVTGINGVHIYCTRLLPLNIYIQSVVFYYMMEFNVTATWQRSKVHSRSFLVYGNVGNLQFLAMQLMTLVEYRLTHSTSLQWTIPSVVGLVAIVCGLGLRYVGMAQCGDSFSHIIDTNSLITDTDQRKLVTHGVYGVFRHPVYLGFWLYAQGIELMMGNWVLLAVVALVMHWFFLVRIPFEEYFLEQIYGDEYRIYKHKVVLGVPLINLTNG